MAGFSMAESAEAIMARLVRRGLPPVQANPAYSIQAVIGNGAYGTVYRALDRRNNNRVVALKEVKVHASDEGVPLSTLREIATLKQLDSYDHPNIVKLFDVYPSGSDSILETKITLVFEFIDQDLSAYLEKATEPLSDSLIKDMMKQMVQGLDFLHENRICHRDLKPQNVLVSRDNRLKICDFGLSRSYACQAAMTSVVVTLWYRCPEVLLQANYATPVDVWSLGCIFGELYLRRPMFQGQSEIDQLHKIFDVIGTPGPGEWPAGVVIPQSSFPEKKKRRLYEIIPGLSAPARSLMESMLIFVPMNRITTQKALEHRYFSTDEEANRVESDFECSSELEPSDESEFYEPTTDEESDVGEGEKSADLNASKVLDLSETSDELELSVDKIMPQTPPATSSTPPAPYRSGPNILRHAGEKKRRSNEKKRESDVESQGARSSGDVQAVESANVVEVDVLNTPRVVTEESAAGQMLKDAGIMPVADRYDSMVFVENGRDFVDGECDKGNVVKFTAKTDRDWSDLYESDSTSILNTGIEIANEVELVDTVDEVVDHMTNIDQLLEAARQSEEQMANQQSTLDVGHNDVGQSATVRGSPEEIEAVKSLLNFSSGLPFASIEFNIESASDNYNGDSHYDDRLQTNVPQNSDENKSCFDVVDGDHARFDPGSKLKSMEHVAVDHDQVSANQNADIDHVTTSTNQMSDSADTGVSNVSPETDDNSNILDRKRKYDSADDCCQQVKRRRV